MVGAQRFGRFTATALSNQEKRRLACAYHNFDSDVDAVLDAETDTLGVGRREARLFLKEYEEYLRGEP